MNKSKKKEKSQFNIVLVGMMGSGKSAVGRLLSKSLKYSFYDIDTEIVKKENQSIKEIFNTKSEVYFRNLESQQSDFIKTLNHSVISTGGGFVINPIHCDTIKQIGCVIYLRSTNKTLLSRLKDDKKRPLLQKNKDKLIEAIFKERSHIYESVSDIIVDTDNLSVSDVVNSIIEKIKINEVNI